MKTSKQLFIIAINIFIVLLISSCEKFQNKLHETQLYAPQEGTDLEIDILSDTDWEIVAQPDWLEVISKDDKSLRINVFENEGSFLRNGKIKLKIDNNTSEINIYQASFTEEFKKCYVTFDPKGHKGNHLFKVYTQSTTKPNYYWRFTIAHEQNLSDNIYSDQYRILNCKEFIYNGEEMLPTGAALLYLGESEFTYKRSGASEPTGGYHGREKFTEVNFLINGNLINDITTEFKMRSCESFTYTQKSIMYRDDNMHTEDAEHIKTTKISDGGYFTKNTITAKVVIPMNTCFGSLASISVDVAKKGYGTNKENVISFNKDGNRKLEEYGDVLFVWNDTKKLSATIKSKFNINNDYATQCIWDNKHYGKYYRYFQHINLNEGESWFFETKVTFNKL